MAPWQTNSFLLTAYLFAQHFTSAQEVNPDNTTFCVGACQSFEIFYDNCDFYDSVNDESLSSCTCFAHVGDPWRRYSLLLGCTMCDEEGIGNHVLGWYQQWAVACNVFRNAGNEASQLLVEYGEPDDMINAFSESLLPPLQTMGNDDDVVMRIPVTVNGTTTTVGGKISDGSELADASATVTVAEEFSSTPASVTATKTVAPSSTTSDPSETDEAAGTTEAAETSEAGSESTTEAASASETAESGGSVLRCKKGWTVATGILALCSIFAGAV